MKRLLLFCATLLIALTSAATPLFENGKTRWQITVPEKSNAVIDYAAGELADTLKKVSGTAFTIGKNRTKQFNIILGTPETSPEIAGLQKDFKIPDAEAIDTIAVYARNNNLYLAGNNNRSVLYAVYTFLQKQLGVRWLWPGDDGEFITPLKKYTIPADLAINFTPSFRIRAMSPCHWHRHVPTEIWMARNFLNGDSRTAAIRDKTGAIRIGGGHRVIVYNAKKVFKSKPELFSLIGGRRDVAGYVGCWSNPEFTAQVVENVAKLIRKNNLELLNLFPGDITLRCECEKCTVDPDRSSRWYDYYYQLITELKKQFPKLKFAGIAYQEYRALPKTEVRGLEYVEYCHYNRCYAHKLTDPKCKINAGSLAEMKRWQEKAPFAIYGYEFDIFKPATLLPNWYATADAMRTYRDLKAVRLKTEMSVYYPKGVPRHELAPQINRLANWIWANLAWNADGDADAMIKDFCETVYGKKAAPFMIKYYQILGNAWVKQNNHPTYFGRNPVGSAHVLFDDKLLKLCRTLINKAKAAIRKSDKRRMADIEIDSRIFQKWEEYFNIAGNRVTITPPYQQNSDNFDRALVLPLTPKKSGLRPKATTIKMFWDDNGVNILAECMEPEMKNIRKSSTDRDQGVWKDDNLEMMLDPGDGEPFRHLVVTAGNNRYDALGNDPEYNPQWSSEVVRKADRWIARIRLPFASFGKWRKNLTWQFMIIRNSKPVSIGFPRPAHMDITGAGTIFFTKEAKEVKKLIWISSAKYPKSFDPYRKFFLDNGWYCQFAAGEKAAEELNFNDAKMILIEPSHLNFQKDFWQKKIAPAVQNGATLIFRSYHWLGMLGKHLGDPTYAVSSRENAHKIKKPTSIDPDFAKAGHDLTKTFRSCGTLTFTPKYPEKWNVLMTQLIKNGEKGASIIGRRFGKGKIYIIAQLRSGPRVLENMVNYDLPAK